MLDHNLLGKVPTFQFFPSSTRIEAKCSIVQSKYVVQLNPER